MIIGLLINNTSTFCTPIIIDIVVFHVSPVKVLLQICKFHTKIIPMDTGWLRRNYVTFWVFYLFHSSVEGVRFQGVYRTNSFIVVFIIHKRQACPKDMA